MGDSPTYRTKAFISYSHADKPYLEQLQKHLKAPYVRESNIKVWDDTQIQPGMNWQEAIERALAEAQVAILLVSVDFLASDFVAKVELPKLLAAARAGDIKILPVILGYCGFERSRLDQFQSVNDPANPLESLPKPEQDKIWLKVAKLTHDTLKEKRQEWSEKAKSLFEAEKYEEALFACEYVLQSKPDDVFALKYKGATLFHLHRYEEALASLQQALEPVPRTSFLAKSAFVLKYEGASLFHLARYKEALEALDMSLRSDKAAAFALKYKGAALFHLEREVEALGVLDEALKLEPKGAFASKYKGAALVTLEQENEALVVLEQAFKLEPGDGFTLRYYGAALLGLRRYGEARGVVEQALLLEPGNSFALTLKRKIEKIIQYKNKLAQVEAAPAPRKAAN